MWIKCVKYLSVTANVSWCSSFCFFLGEFYVLLCLMPLFIYNVQNMKLTLWSRNRLESLELRDFKETMEEVSEQWLLKFSFHKCFTQLIHVTRFLRWSTCSRTLTPPFQFNTSAFCFAQSEWVEKLTLPLPVGGVRGPVVWLRQEVDLGGAWCCLSCLPHLHWW